MELSLVFSVRAQLRITRQLPMNLLSEILVSGGREGGRRQELELGELERRVETPDLAGLETVCLGVG